MKKFYLFTFIFIIFSGYHCSTQYKIEKDEWYITTEDKSAKLYVLEFGQGETFVVLHGGWGAEHSYLLDAFEGFEKEYHFVFYDQRGSLRSPCPENSISIEKHIGDLEKIRKELGLEKMNIVCHSMGSFLAMSYLEKYPNKVGRIVLIGALPVKTPSDVTDKFMSAKQAPAIKAFFERKEIAAELKRQGLDKKDEEKTEKEKSHSWKIRFASANIFHVERWKEMKGGKVFYNAKAGAAAVQTMPDLWDFTATLKNHPNLISFIQGDHDFVDWKSEMNKRIAMSTPNIKLFLIKDAGHVPWIDQPKEFRKLLKKALG
ncbi:alpha/beta fold hydrolase [Acidobacteriota bacterium]